MDPEVSGCKPDVPAVHTGHFRKFSWLTATIDGPNVSAKLPIDIRKNIGTLRDHVTRPATVPRTAANLLSTGPNPALHDRHLSIGDREECR
ncbi:hypothetical protein KBX50_32220 [Micromonospora sp. C51]|uniref:hypothetical protein n=1 Tax=Micromonospora sp. C51 TaxID=2824879 RepID=UPI001B36A853|nr:hypothetical protein [Micromonospora sp. C51]MBQ1053104.1 hypothetical protein [Micromonospora sp. C51]